MLGYACWSSASLISCHRLFSLQACASDGHCYYIGSMGMVMRMIGVLHSMRMHRGCWKKPSIVACSRRWTCSSYIPISYLLTEFPCLKLHFSEAHLLCWLWRSVACCLLKRTKTLMMVGSMCWTKFPSVNMMVDPRRMEGWGTSSCSRNTEGLMAWLFSHVIFFISWYTSAVRSYWAYSSLLVLLLLITFQPKRA